MQIPDRNDQKVERHDGVRRDAEQPRRSQSAARRRVDSPGGQKHKRPPDDLEGLLRHVVHDQLGGLERVGEAEGREGGAGVEGRAGRGAEGLAWLKK
jgi:hypothetical protein